MDGGLNEIIMKEIALVLVANCEMMIIFSQLQAKIQVKLQTMIGLNEQITGSSSSFSSSTDRANPFVAAICRLQSALANCYHCNQEFMIR